MAALALALAVQAPSFAAGGGGGSDAKRSKTVTECRNGRVWSERRQRCVRARSSEITPDQRFEAGRALAYAGRFEDAITVLSASNKRDARTLNMLGYAHRKSGMMGRGMAYYRDALRIDPNFTLARSYMGIGLLDGGDRAGAEAQLARIADIAGTGAPEYALLAQALEDGAGDGARPHGY